MWGLDLNYSSATLHILEATPTLDIYMGQNSYCLYERRQQTSDPRDHQAFLVYPALLGELRRVVLGEGLGDRNRSNVACVEPEALRRFFGAGFLVSGL